MQTRATSRVTGRARRELTSRRAALQVLPVGAAALLSVGPTRASDAPAAVDDDFPSQDRERVYQMVLHAHTDLEQVERLVGAQPDLAKSAIDWGFGDWESALGAAAHMGRRDIARVLIDAGARPDLFTHAMLGHLEVVRAAVEAEPGIHHISGPHGFSLRFHARAGGDPARPVLEFLDTLDDGDSAPEERQDPLPLATSSYTGRYAYGDGRFFEIRERNGTLRFQRGDDFPRNLRHLGQSRFRPGGSLGVELRFEIEAQQAVAVEIRDPEVIVRGTRL